MQVLWSLSAVGMMAAAVLFGSVLRVQNKIRMSYIGLPSNRGFHPLPVEYFLRQCGFSAFVVLMRIYGAFGNIHTIPFISICRKT